MSQRAEEKSELPLLVYGRLIVGTLAGVACAMSAEHELRSRFYGVHFDGRCGFHFDLLLLTGPAVAEAVDEAGGDSEIVLTLKGEEWIHKARALIVPGDPEGEWAAKGAFDASAESIRKTSLVALKLAGWRKGNCAIDPGGADEGVHEDSGFSAVLDVIDRADEGGEHVVGMVSSRQNAGTGEGKVESRAPARSEMQKRIAVDAIEVDSRCGRRGHAHEDISAASFKNREGARGAIICNRRLFRGSLRSRSLGEELDAKRKKEKQ